MNKAVNNSVNKMELLAPAGSRDCVVAAVQSGADAVYIGGSKFNARRSAENFTIQEMKAWVDYCHIRGVKVHVAVNVLIKEAEIDDLVQYAYELNDIGVDAVIVQDLGAASIFRQIVPDLPLHASTQMTIHNLEGVRAMEVLGFERVVLSRELTKNEIAFICKNAKAEIEVFVHGALCMCYSGQCLMSSMIGGRSGNRGRCAQPCRLPYELLEHGKTVASGYLLSPKDLALFDHLKELSDMGVASLKIEGRLKRPEYVAAVTGVYRRCIDRNFQWTKDDKTELLDAFNRSGFTSAYYAGETGKTMMTYQVSGNQSKNIFTDAVKQRCREDANERKIPISIEAQLSCNQPLALSLTDGDENVVFIEGTQKSEPAQKWALDRERLAGQLCKLGATPFMAEEVHIKLEDGITLPLSEINALRRKAVSQLEQNRVERPKRQGQEFQKNQDRKIDQKHIELTVEVNTIDQAETALSYPLRRLYVPYQMYDRVKAYAGSTEVVAILPPIEKGGIVKTDAASVLITSVSQIEAYRKRRLYADWRLNIYNSYAVRFFDTFQAVTLSPELNEREIRQVSQAIRMDTETVAYGRLPLMTMQNCPIKASCGKCQNGRMDFSLRDRKGMEFPLLCGHECAPVLLNAKPIFMADKLANMNNLKINAARLIFTVEKSGECDKIIKMYQCALEGENEGISMAENTFTRGHFTRGVE